MKTFLFPLLLVFLTFIQSSAQDDQWCGTDDYNEQLPKGPAQQKFADELFEKLAQESRAFYENKESYRDDDDEEIYIIPLVVHVIHDNGVGNISYEQIVDGVRILNEDLRRMNADSSSTREVFKPFAADSRIEFRLAKIDPDGNCTNGVVRINDSFFAYNGNDDAKQLSMWPTDKYFNYWLADHLPTSGEGTLLGYARFPWWGITSTYGVMQRHDRFGSIGTAANSDGRTTSHEVGHCLGLYHTFQGGCGDDCSDSGDRVCDTPPVDERSWVCALAQNSCGNDMDGPSPFTEDVMDQVENYMSYNNCQNMFSEGQKVRMRFYLENISELQNLVSQSNLEATGVFDDPLLCEADFEADRKSVCVGQTVEFSDMSFDSEMIESREWHFEGGYPETSNDSVVGVVYDEPGEYAVELIVSDGSNYVNKVIQEYIYVEESATHNLVDGFETYNTSLDQTEEWTVITSDPGRAWEIVSDAAYEGDKSVFVNNLGKPSGRVEQMVSQAYNLSDKEEMVLSFYYAYAPRSGSDDVLRLKFSHNCGESYLIRQTISGNSLQTAPTSNVPFYPESQAEWKYFEMPLHSGYLVENFKLLIEFKSGDGNNIFIDNINLYDPATVSTQQIELDNFVKAYPNPNSGDFFIDYRLVNTSQVDMALFDISGRIVLNKSLGQMSSGAYTEQMNIQHLPGGVYFLQMNIDDQKITKKIVVN